MLRFSVARCRMYQRVSLRYNTLFPEVVRIISEFESRQGSEMRRLKGHSPLLGIRIILSAPRPLMPCEEYLVKRKAQ